MIFDAEMPGNKTRWGRFKRSLRVRLKLALRKASRSFARMKRSARIRTKVTWRRFIRSPRISELRNSKRAMAGAIIAAIAFVALAIWSQSVSDQLYAYLVQLPWARMMWWVGGAIALIALIALLYWLLKSPTRRTATARGLGYVPWGKIIGWGIAAFLLYSIVDTFRYNYSKVDAKAPYNVHDCITEVGNIDRQITKLWSEPIQVPLGCDMIWQDIVTEFGYEVEDLGKSDDGKDKVINNTKYPKGITCDPHSGVESIRVRFRLLDSEPANTAILTFQYGPQRTLGGPPKCTPPVHVEIKTSEVVPPSTEPLPSEPPPPPPTSPETSQDTGRIKV